MNQLTNPEIIWELVLSFEFCQDDDDDDDDVDVDVEEEEEEEDGDDLFCIMF
jgi:hypothetical protein